MAMSTANKMQMAIVTPHKNKNMKVRTFATPSEEIHALKQINRRKTKIIAELKQKWRSGRAKISSLEEQAVCDASELSHYQKSLALKTKTIRALKQQLKASQTAEEKAKAVAKERLKRMRTLKSMYLDATENIYEDDDIVETLGLLSDEPSDAESTGGGVVGSRANTEDALVISNSDSEYVLTDGEADEANEADTDGVAGSDASDSAADSDQKTEIIEEESKSDGDTGSADNILFKGVGAALSQAPFQPLSQKYDIYEAEDETDVAMDSVDNAGDPESEEQKDEEVGPQEIESKACELETGESETGVLEIAK